MAGESADAPELAPVATSGTAVERAAVPQPPEPPSLGEAVARLADFARRAYGRDHRRNLRTLLYPTDPTLLEVLVETYQAAGVIGPLSRKPRADEPTIHYATEVSLPYLARVRQAYLDDLAVMTPVAQDQAFFEAIRRLNANEVLRLNLEAEMLDPPALRALHAAARDYLVKRLRALHGLTRETAGFTNKDFLAAERGVHEAIDNAHLTLLASHKERDRLIPQLAVSLERAEAVVRSVFDEAKEAIFAFGDELDASRDHVWRYPPIVSGAAANILAAAGVEADVASFAAYLANLADEKGFDPVSLAFFVAGVVVVAVTLVVLPGGGAIVAALEGVDAALATYGAVRSYRQEREIELGNTATVLKQGASFAPREANFGLVALEGWAALLTAAGFLGVLRRTVQSARTSVAPVAGTAGEAEVTASRGTRAAVADEAAQARSARQSTAAQRGVETPAAARQARRQARPRRAATRATRRAAQRRRAVGMDERGINDPLGGESTERELIDSLENEPGTLVDDPLPTRTRARGMAPRDPSEVLALADDILKQTGGDPRRALAIVRAQHGDTALADQLAEAIMLRQPAFRGFGPALGGRKSADFQRLVTGRDHEFVFDLPEPVGVTSGGRPRTETRIDGITASDLVDAKYTEGDITQSAHVTRGRRVPAEAREELAIDRRIVEEARARSAPTIDDELLAETLDQMTRQLMLAEAHGFPGVRWVCATPDLARHFQAVYEASNLPQLFKVEFRAVVFEPGELIR